MMIKYINLLIIILNLILVSNNVKNHINMYKMDIVKMDVMEIMLI